MARGWRLEGDMEVKLDQLDMKVKRGMVAAANYVAPLAESHMKTTAPWTDRTAAARNGLRAQVVVGGDKVAIIMYHSVPYGVYLETRWGGRFAVIAPTMQVMSPLFARTVGRMVFGSAA